MISEQIKEEDIPTLIQQHFPSYKKDLIKLNRLQGMTNKTYKVSVQNEEPLFLCIYGIMNKNAIVPQIFKQLSEEGLAPKLHYSCERYLIAEFIQNARHPTHKQLQTNKEVINSILKEIHKFHSMEVPSIKDKELECEKTFSEQMVQKLSKLDINTEELKERFAILKNKCLSILQDRENLKKKLLPSNKDHVKFCHNDLNNINMFIRNQEDQLKTILIDYDYVAYNYIGYDLANFLNQMCIEYIQVSPGFKVIHKTNLQQIKHICQNYQGHYEGLETDIRKFLILCNLYWACWSLQSSIDNVLPTFDVLAHGQARLQLYHYYSEQLFGKQQ